MESESVELVEIQLVCGHWSAVGATERSLHADCCDGCVRYCDQCGYRCDGWSSGPPEETCYCDNPS